MIISNYREMMHIIRFNAKHFFNHKINIHYYYNGEHLYFF